METPYDGTVEWDEPDEWFNGGNNDVPTIQHRTRKILREFSREINPSTGKPFLYMEDGVFGKVMTYYPKLKDVRGQVIPKGLDGYIGGINDYDVGGKYISRGPVDNYKDKPTNVAKNINNFYARYGNVELPKDVTTHLNLIYKVDTNSTWEKASGRAFPSRRPWRTPRPSSPWCSATAACSTSTAITGAG